MTKTWSGLPYHYGYTVHTTHGRKKQSGKWICEWFPLIGCCLRGKGWCRPDAGKPFLSNRPPQGVAGKPMTSLQGKKKIFKKLPLISNRFQLAWWSMQRQGPGVSRNFRSYFQGSVTSFYSMEAQTFLVSSLSMVLAWCSQLTQWGHRYVCA